MTMIVLVVILFGTDVIMRPMDTMSECVDHARRIALTADRGNVAKQPHWWSVECKQLAVWMNG